MVIFFHDNFYFPINFSGCFSDVFPCFFADVFFSRCFSSGCSSSSSSSGSKVVCASHDQADAQRGEKSTFKAFHIQFFVISFVDMSCPKMDSELLNGPVQEIACLSTAVSV
jgi:hypothetical protein